MPDRRVPVLAHYRLPKREFLTVEPSRDARGHWRVKFCAEGDLRD